MASHFEAIGIKIDSMEEMEDLFSKCLEHGIETDTKSGKYFFWDMGNGAELWGQLDPDNEAGLNPHFSGTSSFNAILESEIKDEERPVMDGSVYCQSVEGQYPFVADIPDMKVHNITYPKTCNIQLSAFAHNVDIYESEEEYDKKNTSEPKFAMEHFIPTGLFADEGHPRPRPARHGQAPFPVLPSAAAPGRSPSNRPLPGRPAPPPLPKAHVPACRSAFHPTQAGPLPLRSGARRGPPVPYTARPAAPHRNPVRPWHG